MAEQDDGLQKLEQFVGLLAETRSKLQEYGDQIEASVQELDKAVAESEEKIGAFNGSVEEFTTTFDGEYKQMLEALDKHDATIAESGLKALEARSEKLGEAEDGFEEAIQGAVTELKTDFGELAEEGYGALGELMDGLGDEVSAIQTETEESFKGLGEAVDGLEQEADTALKATSETFQDVASNVAGTFTSQMDGVFSDISSHLTETTVGQFESGFEGISGNLEDIFGSTEETLQRTAGELIEAGGSILGDMTQNIGGEVMNAIEEGAKEAIEETIAGLLAETAESIAMMGVGAATTGALSPIIPQLAVAKNVVGTINDLLDALNPFD